MLKHILSIFLQENCPLCERATPQEICDYCQKQLKSCQLKDPKIFWGGELPLFVWGEYDGKLKQAIAALKYDKHPKIGELLGFCLAETWQKYALIDPNLSPLIIPIPLHKTKEKSRGFNQSEIIGRGFCQVTKYPLKSNGLIRVRQTKAMFGLSVTEKEKNMKGAFQLGKSLQNTTLSKPVLLIDDIYTTGTTVKEAVKILQSQGIKVLGVLAVCSPRRL
ncbi:ComF family protein [Cyanothece sp. BG0011]|uniref:ComF family protein n=1 Tax=Cyanothece sp. BG0011 TaxID=2082950 RepID=UPI000D1DDF6C|nr:ComF family protein [Cyanothece sp. BG0011]